MPAPKPFVLLTYDVGHYGYNLSSPEDGLGAIKGTSHTINLGGGFRLPVTEDGMHNIDFFVAGGPRFEAGRSHKTLGQAGLMLPEYQSALEDSALEQDPEVTDGTNAEVPCDTDGDGHASPEECETPVTLDSVADEVIPPNSVEIDSSGGSFNLGLQYAFVPTEFLELHANLAFLYHAGKYGDGSTSLWDYDTYGVRTVDFTNYNEFGVRLGLGGAFIIPEKINPVDLQVGAEGWYSHAGRNIQGVVSGSDTQPNIQHAPVNEGGVRLGVTVFFGGEGGTGSNSGANLANPLAPQPASAVPAPAPVALVPAPAPAPATRDWETVECSTVQGAEHEACCDAKENLPGAMDASCSP